MTDKTTREQQLEAALFDFYYAADQVVRELNVVQPFTAIALKHAAVLRTLPGRGVSSMADQNSTTEPTLFDLIVDYLQRGPASLGNVASHFGMLPLDAQRALDALERQGKARRGRYFLWELHQ